MHKLAELKQREAKIEEERTKSTLLEAKLEESKRVSEEMENIVSFRCFFVFLFFVFCFLFFELIN